MYYENAFFIRCRRRRRQRPLAAVVLLAGGLVERPPQRPLPPEVEANSVFHDDLKVEVVIEVVVVALLGDDHVLLGPPRRPPLPLPHHRHGLRQEIRHSIVSRLYLHTCDLPCILSVGMVSQVPFHCNSQFKVFNYVSNFGSSCRSETENIARRLSFWRVGQILGRERGKGGSGLFKVSNSISVDSRRQRLPSAELPKSFPHPPTHNLVRRKWNEPRMATAKTGRTDGFPTSENSLVASPVSQPTPRVLGSLPSPLSLFLRSRFRSYSLLVRSRKCTQNVMDLQCASFKGQNWSRKTMAGQSKLSNSLRKPPPPMDVACLSGRGPQVSTRECFHLHIPALVTICTFELLLLTAHHPLPPRSSFA